MALEKALMKNLKNLLRYNKLLIILTFLTFIYILINIFLPHYSKYNGNETKLTGIITNIKFKNDLLELEIKGKETIIAYYKYNNLNNINIGDKVTIYGKIKKVNSNNIPNTFNYENYLKYKKIYYTFNINKLYTSKNNNIFYKLKNIIFKRIIKLPNKDYYLTFILGNKSLLDNKTYNNYLTNGVSHMLAISGMHVSILLLLFKKNKILKTIVLLLFLFLTGFTSSVYRVVIFNILKMFNKNKSNIYLLILTMDILLLIDPFRIYDIGFIYSFLVTFGIFYYHKNIKNIFQLSLITFLFSLPITALVNYEINILSIINNIIFVPIVSFIVYPLCLISFLFPFLTPVFSIVISILNNLNFIFSKISIFITIPKFNIILLFIYYIFLLKKYNKLYLILIILLNILLPKLDSSYSLYFLDVGQGDSALLISPYKKETILIDTGGKINSSYKVSDNTIRFLKSKGITKIDYMILTHGDYDHIADAINIINKIKVKNVTFNCGQINELEQPIINRLKVKKIKYHKCINNITTKNFKLNFLNTKSYEDENNSSSVIYTKIKSKKILFMADAEEQKEQDILKKYKIKNIDILKVGHHGSKTSSSTKFIEQIKPKYSIISVGKNNSYGHPNINVLNNLKKSKIYRTDESGTITLKITNNNLLISESK